LKEGMQHRQHQLLQQQALSAEAIRILLQRSKLVVEGAGAAGVAFLLSKEFNRLKIRNKRICIIISGGNISMQKLKKIIP
jgi:threonine dehydratase